MSLWYCYKCQTPRGPSPFNICPACGAALHLATVAASETAQAPANERNAIAIRLAEMLANHRDLDNCSDLDDRGSCDKCRTLDAAIKGLSAPPADETARLREALNKIASWGEGEIGSHMDEPHSAAIARAALAQLDATGTPPKP